MLCQHSVSVFCVCVEVHAAVWLAKTPCVLRARAGCPCCLPAQWGAAIARRVVLTTTVDLRIPLHTYGFHQLVRPNV